MLAGASVTVAIPEELVSAVPPDGVIVASVASVEKVITVLATGAPLVSVSVARAVVGALLEIEVTELPPESSSVKTSVPLAVVVVPVGGVVVEFVLVVTAWPPQPASENAVAERIASKAFEMFK